MHEGMTWGAVAMTRTTAIGLEEPTLSNRPTSSLDLPPKGYQQHSMTTTQKTKLRASAQSLRPASGQTRRKNTGRNRLTTQPLSGTTHRGSLTRWRSSRRWRILRSGTRDWPPSPPARSDGLPGKRGERPARTRLATGTTASGLRREFAGVSTGAPGIAHGPSAISLRGQWPVSFAATGPPVLSAVQDRACQDPPGG